MLGALLAGVTPRATVCVRFADSAREGLRRCGFDGPAAVLEDLNRDLRAAYAEPPDKSGSARPTVTAYGQHLEVKFVPTREDAERLLAISVARVQPSLLNKRRQQAVSMPFSPEPRRRQRLSAHRGRPSQHSTSARHEEVAVAKVRDLFELGRFVLERQRARLVHLSVRCRVDDGVARGRQGGTGVGAERPGGRRATSGHRRAAVGRPDRGSDDLPLRWADGMDEKSSFSVRHRASVGSAASIRPAC